MGDRLRIIFAGTPDFSVPPLRALLASPHQVVAVYTQPDRPAGRGRKLAPGPVKQTALEGGVAVFQPRNFRDEADLARLEAHRADLMVVVAYGLILPQRVLDAPRLGCINIHASLLPRWRGAAPIQRAIQAGDAASGITIMRMELGLDTGPMLLKRVCPIAPEETGGSLHDKLSLLGAEALMEALPGIAAGGIGAQPQDDAQANYARKLEKAESRIDWRQGAREIERQVRAFNPWPVAQADLDGQPLRIWEAVALEGAQETPGRVLDESRRGIDVATGDGVLRITRLQMPGKRAVAAADFLNANTLSGVVLG
ncbi:MAG: methionyl-tRNA formyltransferase [Candidatus Sedimenticola endophacoides]|uniref:Methionyl-tRNA formyltransferase n=1 Tax=Candidatus Sedimenticola endophacoides TaxID=2548426 RepID=A0A6N4E1K2_9GAMM|nr:MAG: methionyl-tRNA formyltransferase [Candidatus Sedimenticola endophacoides]OQX35205.1 MAG: methionyl-tRNA formyltransferase [Candidatus Sedimenticola endophacoides]OQX41205.1 MAG: methionyl-tRNA formyltransferase [Candidatus Sedimenticola endophacoides]OQX42840.1 MAG: methionyl-tRNA formyltransferase [Candidatus Sedimenticola endophacoides]PUD99667.1 MAG: methionyl-tRNA formyltransferase [Candidatus Sedimenticola endophacoides]